MSNSIGKTAIIVFSSFITLNWAINTIQSCISNAHAIVISSLINIAGDYISIKLGYNEVGVYVATIISQLVNTILLLLFSKYKWYRSSLDYIKQNYLYKNIMLCFSRYVPLAYNSLNTKKI